MKLKSLALATGLSEKMNEQQKKCLHEILHFGSGAFFIFCKQCSQTWIAHKDARDADLDRDAGNCPVTGEERVRPLPLPDAIFRNLIK